jgi:2,3-dihydroxyethylbenzene 1,2-dioxygenase
MAKVCVTELSYLGFEVGDLDAWRTWASGILGMEYAATDGGARLRMDYWHERIRLREGPADDLSYAGFRLTGPEDFWAMQRQLADLGVAFQVASAAEAAERNVLELIKLEDPAGLPIELFHGARVDRHVPFRPGRGMHGKFNSGEGGMGHMVIRNRGVAASDRFYRDALGMRGGVEVKTPTPRGEVAISFLHSNSRREHSVGFGLPGVTKCLHHFMVEVDTIDDVGLAYDLAKQNNVPILLGLGRHSNDCMVSFYMQTPSGFYCEYGWGGSPAHAQSEYNPGSDIWGHETIASFAD